MENKIPIEIKLPCNCWEGYECDYCVIRKSVVNKLKKKYGVFNPKFEQNAELFIRDAINETIELTLSSNS